jgi:septation ring formation regulator EzrA
MEQMENELEQLKDAMENEYQKNKESVEYSRLHTRFLEVEATYDAAKKEIEKFWDEFNNRRKRCSKCGAYKSDGTPHCPS